MKIQLRRMVAFCSFKNEFYLKLATDPLFLIFISILFHSEIVLAAKVRPPSVLLLYFGHIKCKFVQLLRCWKFIVKLCLIGGKFEIKDKMTLSSNSFARRQWTRKMVNQWLIENRHQNWNSRRIESLNLHWNQKRVDTSSRKSFVDIRQTTSQGMKSTHDFQPKLPAWTLLELRPASVGCNINRQPKKTYVVSSFGRCCGLLKQRVYPNDGFIASTEFSKVIREINCMKLEEASANYFGAHFENEAEQLKEQLEASNKPIDPPNTGGLSMKLMDLHSLECKCGGSSQNNLVSNYSDKSIEETRISPIGPIIKKRKFNSMY